MGREREIGKYVLPVLISGFTLLIVLLVASAYIGIGALRSAQTNSARMIDQQRATVQLIDDIQREEDSLSGIFYSLTGERDVIDRAQLLRRLDDLEREIRSTTRAGIATANLPLWREVRSASEAFIQEGREVLRNDARPSRELYRTHEELIGVLAELANSNFQSAVSTQSLEYERAQSRIQYSLFLVGITLLLAFAGAVLTVYVVNKMFRHVQWQANELSLLSARSMHAQEESARRFSRELHDQFGQTLSAIEANLVAMHHAREYNSGRMEDCLALIKDAIENVREVSQLFRPSILDDFGLDASLRWLADKFSARTGIRVHYESSFSGRLEGETETQLFRIGQEALTNVGRHSNATQVRMHLEHAGGVLRLTVADNGHGLPPVKLDGGSGMIGMRARARAENGTLSVQSAPGQGVIINVELPMRGAHAEENTSIVGR